MFIFKILLLLFIAHNLSASDQASPTFYEKLQKSKSIRDVHKVIFSAISEDKIDATISDIDKYILEVDVKKAPELSKAQIIFDYGQLLKIASNKENSIDFLKWIADSKRLAKYIYSLSTRDDASKSFEIMTALYEHDPKDRKKFFNLMVAMSLVWDQPRKQIHYQMGPSLLSYRPEVENRYDYFKETYTRNAKMSYSRLSIQDLIFVVDTPVPISELEWAKKNVKSSVKKWGNLYSSIVYNHKRLESEQYQWIHGDYKLSDIHELGGICVDQAYYTIMTARAFGVPAMYFRGVGRNAGERHAWAGHMISTNKWNLDVGRYSQHNYVTGFAVDPQTNSQMTDHLLDFKCTGEFSKDSYFSCKRLTEMAAFYLDKKDTEKAFHTARLALKKSSLYLPAWAIVEKYYLEKENHLRLVLTLKSKMAAFRKYPDFSYHIGQKAVDILEEIGEEREANDLRALMKRSIKSREDLSESFVKEKVKELYSSQKAEEARNLYEKYLLKQKGMYGQIEADIKLYLKYTKENGQTNRAPKFLKGFLKGERYKLLKHYLAEAYMNDGNESHAARVR